MTTSYRVSGRQGKAARSFYWAIQTSNGYLFSSCADCVPSLFYHKPWVSKEGGEVAVKVHIEVGVQIPVKKKSSRRKK